jgi:Fe-Mn family superoxide dismutase
MYTLPTLPYELNALEPYIDAKTMEIHHGKHHQTYVDKLNAGLEAHPEFAATQLAELLKNLNTLPETLKPIVRNHGGGHYNHALFWETLGTNKPEPTGKLAEAISRDFGSFAEFKQKLSEQAINRFGSGWAFLNKDENGKLSISSHANQDNPLSDGLNVMPILGLDVWEHAYYLNYQNRRAEYVENFFKIINWEVVENLYG